MIKHVYCFVEENGFSPIEKFIDTLMVKERAKIKAYIKILREFGHNVRRPIADYLGEGIYELRPAAHRVFYFFYLRDSIVLLHVLRKNTDKIPINDLKLCIKRKMKVELLGILKETNL